MIWVVGEKVEGLMLGCSVAQRVSVWLYSLAREGSAPVCAWVTGFERAGGSACEAR